MKRSHKLLSLLLALVMVFALMGTAMAADATPVTTAAATGEMSGQIVILHTNDVHGSISGYAKVAAMKSAYEAKGAYVLLMDAGDYSQGSPYVNLSQGVNAVDLMNLAGYDVATLGNHEFDFGYTQLTSNLKAAKFQVVAANVMYNGKAAFKTDTVFTAPDGTKIGVFGLDTPETASKANPEKIVGVTFGSNEELIATAAAEVKTLRDAGCKYVVCLGHLGVDSESLGRRSVDVIKGAAGIDLFIDGHSHTVIDGMKNDYGTGSTMLVSTGTAFKNIGVVVIKDGKLTSSLVPVTDDMATNADVKAKSDAITAAVDKQLSAIVGKTTVLLNGERDPGVRTMETNLGDFATDAMLWYANKEYGGKVDACITNGGGIRASIPVGDISMKTMKTVFPFGNTVVTLKVTGKQLLELLEASTFSAPKAVGAFPQVSGIKFTVDTTKAYDAGEKYGTTTYYGPKTINRVTIQSVNGKAFDENAVYTIATNDFTAAGGDTYHVFTEAAVKATLKDTGYALEDALTNYMTTVLGGTIGAKYAAPQGRITILCTACKTFSDVASGSWYDSFVKYCLDNKLMSGTSATTFSPMKNMDRATFVTMLYALAGSPAVDTTTAFTDVAADAWYAKAVSWAVSKGITKGMTATTFGPSVTMSREQMATFIYAYAGTPAVTGELSYTDKTAVSSWAVSAVNYCTAQKYMTGANGAFDPAGTANRAMGSVVLTQMSKAAAAAAATK